MMNKFEQFQALKAEYDQKKAAIKDNSRLSVEGKKEALRELGAKYLAYFKHIQADLDAQLKELAERKEALEKTAPKAEELSEKELLAEQRSIELFLSRLSAAGKGDFLKVARDEATKRPAIFRRAYHRVIDLAEKLYPKPASSGPVNYFGSVQVEHNINAAEASERGMFFSQLTGVYEQAEAATMTEAEKQHRRVIEALEKQWVDNLLDSMKVGRAVEALEHELRPSFEEVSKFNMEAPRFF